MVNRDSRRYYVGADATTENVKLLYSRIRDCARSHNIHHLPEDYRVLNDEIRRQAHLRIPRLHKPSFTNICPRSTQQHRNTVQSGVGYQAPAYQAPAFQPVYQAPAYQSPAYQAPAQTNPFDMSSLSRTLRQSQYTQAAPAPANPINTSSMSPNFGRAQYVLGPPEPWEDLHPGSVECVSPNQAREAGYSDE